MGGRENPGLHVTEVSESEKLNYIIEMISGLMMIASETRSNTLLAILNAALVEARIQKRDAERDVGH